VKEVALIHSEGILAGEMKHGPLALVDENLPIIVVATQDRMYSKMQSVILQLLARRARLIILCNTGDTAIAKICQDHSGCRLIQVLSGDCSGVCLISGGEVRGVKLRWLGGGGGKLRWVGEGGGGGICIW